MISTLNDSLDPSAAEMVLDSQPEDAVGMKRALPPGTLLDHYRIQRVLSVSGLSAVYLAKDEVADLWVAIKEYLPTNLVEQSISSRAVLRGAAHATAFKRGKFAFLSESRALASCDHPSLLRVNRILNLQGTVYRVMPCYQGRVLQSVRQEAAQASDEASLRWLLEGVLGALEVLHEHEYVHGAISPDNILLLADDRPLLMDFSAVRRAVVSPETQRLMALLAPSYQAAEQVQPRSPEGVPGPWSDVYSVGAVLYFCIAGELPPRGRREPIAAVAHRLQVRQPSLRYSEALLGAIDAALQENIQDRPQSVAEFRRLMEATPSHQGGPSVRPDDELASAQDQAADQPAETLAGESEPPLPEGSAVLLADVGSVVADQPAEGGHDDIRFGLRPARLTELRNGLRRLQLKSRALICAIAACVLGGAGFVAWKVNEQRQAEQLLADMGAVALAAFPGNPLRPYSLEPGQTEEDLLSEKLRPEPPLILPLQEVEAAQVKAELGKEPSGGDDIRVVPSEGPRPGSEKSPILRPAPIAKEPATPIEVCAPRTNFSLYQCMKTQCERARWSRHLQCQRLRDTDEVIR